MITGCLRGLENLADRVGVQVPRLGAFNARTLHQRSGIARERKGEALALRWDRVDLDAETLKVAATIARVNHALTITEPKTVRSRRMIPLSAAVVAMLRKHRTAQKAERLRAGNQ